MHVRGSMRSMLWVDTIVSEIKEARKDAISAGESLVVRDEKTASGRVHVGSMRGVAIHGAIADALNKEDIPAAFKYEINDFDPMDGLPSYLDKDAYAPHMGKQLYNIPAPDGSDQNFAEYYAAEFKSVIAEAGFTPEFYNASELYLSGKMDEVIRLALENAPVIREIYKKTSGAVKAEDWLPLNVVCQNCGKIGTTIAIAFDGEEVTYECREDLVDWARGCSHTGSVSPFGGNAKLPWKVEWPAKFRVLGVAIEGGGKDHSTRGGARDVANHIAREVFQYEPPFDIPYEFFLVDGKKMASSKGAGASSREVVDLLPRKIFRLALLGTRPMRAINFDPAGTTIPTLYDRYDEISEKYWAGTNDDDARLYEVVHQYDPPERYYRMRFSQVAFLVQMPHLDIFEEAKQEKGASLTDIEKGELHERSDYAKRWLASCASSRYVFELQDALPNIEFSEKQKEVFKSIHAFVSEREDVSGEELHQQLHEIKESVSIEPKELFSGLYQAFLGRDSGPQAGWFLSVLPREMLLERLSEASS